MSKTREQLHRETLDGIHETYLAKNADYGNSFTESINEFGLVAAVVRISDKMNRLKSFAKKKDMRVKDESVRDTLLDMANYCIMTAVELDIINAEYGISDLEADIKSCLGE